MKNVGHVHKITGAVCWLFCVHLERVFIPPQAPFHFPPYHCNLQAVLSLPPVGAMPALPSCTKHKLCCPPSISPLLTPLKRCASRSLRPSPRAYVSPQRGIAHLLPPPPSPTSSQPVRVLSASCLPYCCPASSWRYLFMSRGLERPRVRTLLHTYKSLQ